MGNVVSLLSTKNKLPLNYPHDGSVSIFNNLTAQVSIMVTIYIVKKRIKKQKIKDEIISRKCLLF